MTSVYWVAETFGIPLKTTRTPYALHTPLQLYQVLTAFFAFVFMNFDPAPGFKLRKIATEQAKILTQMIAVRLAQSSGTVSVSAWLPPSRSCFRQWGRKSLLT